MSTASTTTPVSMVISQRSKLTNQTMLAIEWEGKDKVKVIERLRPAITDSQDVIVKMTSTAISGSDLHIYHNLLPSKNAIQIGDILGHEAMGIIVEVGPDVKTLKVGDRVVISAIVAEGKCQFCQRQEYSLCDCTNPSKEMEELYGHRTAGVLGYSHLCGGYDGCQAEYIRVPLADLGCLKVPDDLRDEQVLFLSDIVCTGWHGNELAEVKKDDTVAIWGCGPVGLISARWAFIRGAKKVISIDVNPFRLSKARELGCEVLNSNVESDIVKSIFSLVPGGPDCCIDCAGFRFPTTLSHKFQRAVGLETDALDIVQQMVKACRKGGHIALIGTYFAYGNQFPIGPFMEKGLTMRGGQTFVQKYWKELLKYIQEGKFDPTFVITHRLPFSMGAEAYKMYSDQEDDCIKIILKPDNDIEKFPKKQ